MSQGSGYQKVVYDRRRDRKGPQPRKFFDEAGGVTCKSCFELRNKNEELRLENLRLKQALDTALKIPKKDHFCPVRCAA